MIGPAEDTADQPTYDNIVKALKAIFAKANDGDHVLRALLRPWRPRDDDLFRRSRRTDQWDEGLVPTDIGGDEGRYVRDVELAKLFKDAVAKGIVLTVVMDCCHSGGLTRGRHSLIRGIGKVDDRPQKNVESAVAPRDELIANWKAVTASAKTRGVHAGTPLLPDASGYTLLAACRSDEYANETVYEGDRHGAMTYWLMDSLSDLGPGLSYKIVHDRLVAKIRSDFPSQTPQLFGEGNRKVFGVEQIVPRYAITVLSADGDHVKINAGQAHGLHKKTFLDIYPHGWTDFADISERIATVQVTSRQAVDSTAKITERHSSAAITGGEQAMVAGLVKFRGAVHLHERDDLSAAIDQEALLDAVEDAIEDSTVIEVADPDDPAQFQAAISDDGECFEIWDPIGKPVPNQGPCLPTDDEASPAKVVKRLEHLATYSDVLRLSNSSSTSALAHKLEVELEGWLDEDFEDGDPMEPEPFAGPAEIATQQWAVLRIKNASSETLNVALYDMQPDWGISLVPLGGGKDFRTFNPGEEVRLPLRGWLPEHYDDAKDVLKVFATIDTTSFNWLQLPALDKPVTRGRATRSGGGEPSNPLEALFDKLMAVKPKTRQVQASARSSDRWVTEQVELRVSRPAG